MKKLFMIIALIASQSSFAAIIDSQLDARHAAVVETAITESCGYFRDLTLLQVESEAIRVDNGITDYNYNLVLSGLRRIDQNIFDKYIVTVESSYADMYDHGSRNWGVYTAKVLKCEME